MTATPWLWAVFTVAAAFAQTIRNAMQRELTASLGTVGATQVRFVEVGPGEHGGIKLSAAHVGLL